MKILITTDNIGGVWTFSLLLAKGLRRKGVDVTLAIIGNPLSEIEKKQAEYVPRFFYQARQEWMDDPWNDQAGAGRWLMKVNKLIKPDVLHLNSFSLGFLPWNIPVIITAHSCVLSWWEAVNGNELPEKWNIYREHVTKGIQAADTIIAPSTVMLNNVEKFYGPLKKKCMIYNGGVSTGPCTDVRENYIFCMGRLWDEAKNIKLVIDAAPYINHHIYIAGKTEGSEYKTPKNVTFTGPISPDEISCWLSKAAIYLLPVKYEPFGYTFLEAAFSGCAIVTGEIDSMKEIWGDCAVYTDPRNHLQLAEVINNLMADGEKRKMLGEKARNRALINYRAERMVSDYISVYRDEINNMNLKNNLKLQAQ